MKLMPRWMLLLLLAGGLVTFGCDQESGGGDDKPDMGEGEGEGEGECGAGVPVLDANELAEAADDVWRVSGDSGPTSAFEGSCAGRGAETIFRFVAPAAGTWTFTTVHEDTDFDTALYLRTACEDPETELACNDDLARGILQSGFLVAEIAADAEVFIFVDAFSGQGGHFELTAIRADASAAPTLAAVTANRNENVAGLRLDGGDVNGDVVGADIDFLAAGEVMEGSAGFPVGLPDPAFGQLDFAGVGIRVEIPEDFAGADAVRVTLRDSQDQISNAIDAALDPQPEVPVDGACDPLGIDNHCVEGSFCPPAEADNACTAPTAPVLEALVAYRDGDTLIIHVEGSDDTLDANRAAIEVLAAEGDDAIDLGGFTEGFVAFLDPIFGLAEFDVAGFAAADGLFGPTPLPIPEGAARVRVWLTDSQTLQSEQVIADIMPLPLGEAGDACDERRIDNGCAEGTACFEGDEGGWVCTVINAPEITEAAVSFNPETHGLGVAIQGTDVEDDVANFTLQLFNGDPDDGGVVVPEDSDPIEVGFAVLDAADGAFSGAAILSLNEAIVGITHARLTVLDTFGQASDPMVVEIAAPADAGDGEQCDPLGAFASCTDDLVCRGEGGTCTAPICGDGGVDEGEECDDGNLIQGDGCDDVCDLEIEDVSEGGDFEGQVPAGSANIFSLTLDEARTVLAYTHDGMGGCPADTLMVFTRLNAESGEYEEVGRDDDGGMGLCSRLEDDFEAGEYRIVITGFGGNEVPRFMLTVAFPVVVEFGEACDDIRRCGEGAYCPEAVEGEDPPVCTAHVCGDDLVGPEEACDDGNVENGDGCDENCAIEHRCGDGIVGPGEQCDDGNEENDDGCSDECQNEFVDVPAEGGDFASEVPDGSQSRFRYTAEAPGRLLAYTHDGTGEACPAGEDTIITVYRMEDGERVQVGRDDDGGGRGFCSELEFGVDPGDYVIEITGFGGGAVGPFTLTIEVVESAANGDACARSGDADDGAICGGSMSCLMGEMDGVGACGRLPVPELIAEVEPNQTAAEATAVAPGQGVEASLDEEADLFDVFVVTLEADAWLMVRTGNGAGGCPGDSRLYRVDAAILDADGDEAATNADNRLAYNDDFGGVCSRLLEFLPAGDHHFLVDEFGRNSPLDYVLTARIVEAVAADGRCDALGVENICGMGHECTDDDDDNDGVCTPVEE